MREKPADGVAPMGVAPVSALFSSPRAQHVEDSLRVDRFLDVWGQMIRVVDFVKSLVVLTKHLCDGSTAAHDACMPRVPAVYSVRVTSSIFVDAFEARSARTIDDRTAIARAFHDRAFEPWGVIGCGLVFWSFTGGLNSVADANVVDGPVGGAHA